MATGPVPKRSSERRRRNVDAVEIETLNTALIKDTPVQVPKADPEWHEAVTLWYESLARSAQSVFYEPSDWATAYLLAETTSRALGDTFLGMQHEYDEKGAIISESPLYGPQPIKGGELSAILKGMTSLLTTEGERRRVRLEIERSQQKLGEDTPDNVTALFK